MLKGYLHGEGNRDTKFSVEGRIWHRTGDAGRIDQEGNLWLLGRCAGRISDQLGVLYPFTVETAADSLAAVRRSALVRVDGRRTLVVEPAAGSTAAELERLTSKLAWAHIERLLVLPRIPVDRRHNSKVDYPGLARMMTRLERISLRPTAEQFAVRTR